MRAVCPHSLEHGDPQCKNGGRLHANNGTEPEPERYNNCVQCDCPPGWAGIDCSREFSFVSVVYCVISSFCPHRSLLQALQSMSTVRTRAAQIESSMVLHVSILQPGLEENSAQNWCPEILNIKVASPLWRDVCPLWINPATEKASWRLLK